mgnify:CR=1 FL=1
MRSLASADRQALNSAWTVYLKRVTSQGLLTAKPLRSAGPDGAEIIRPCTALLRPGVGILTPGPRMVFNEPLVGLVGGKYISDIIYYVSDI